MNWRCGLAATMLLSCAAWAGGDVVAGATKAESCVACHGAGGNKPISNYPKLAGQSRQYMLQVMREYRDGTRINAVMKGQVNAMSDEDLEDLAAYFAAQPGDLR